MCIYLDKLYICLNSKENHETCYIHVLLEVKKEFWRYKGEKSASNGHAKNASTLPFERPIS